MRLAFVSGLSDKKLRQKLAPLQALPEVERIDLFRREPFAGRKLVWRYVPAALRGSAVVGDVWRLIALLATGWRYDLLVGCHQRFHGVIAAVAGLVWRKAVVQMLIGSVDWAWGDPRYRWALTRASACAVRGENAGRQLRERGFAGPIAVVANPLTWPELPPRDDARPRAYDLIAVGDYAAAKDYPWMLEVLARVRDRIPTVRLAIAGRGPYRQHLGEHIARLGLEPHLTFLGWQDETGLARAYRASAVLILTSRREGLPMVVLEAMSHGVPVAVTGVGELPRLVQDGRGGRVVAHGDTRAMAEAVVGLLADPEARAEQGRLARARVGELLPHYTTEAASAAWRELFRAIGLAAPAGHDCAPGGPSGVGVQAPERP